MTQQEFEADLRETLESIRRSVGSATFSLYPELDRADMEHQALYFHFTPGAECANHWGVTHGGIICTLFDNVMGSTVKAYSGVLFTPTVNMQVSFLRPMATEQPVYFRAQVLSCSRHVCNVTASAWQQDENAPCANAVSCYFLRRETGAGEGSGGNQNHA